MLIRKRIICSCCIRWWLWHGLVHFQVLISTTIRVILVVSWVYPASNRVYSDQRPYFEEASCWLCCNFLSTDLQSCIEDSSQHFNANRERENTQDNKNDIRIVDSFKSPVKAAKFDFLLPIVVTIFEDHARPDTSCSINTSFRYIREDQKL